MLMGTNGTSAASSDGWRRLRELFERACDVPRERRRAFVEEECAGDVSLREEVLALLDSHEGDPEFLKPPKRKDGEREGELVGTEIAGWRITRFLGAGGMGAV
ncbi:MAG: hypothetical protein VYC34_07140, partial [Planctomycetota bacterium]|nr:hypothetical protein [Planctomycetota bacterium]